MTFFHYRADCPDYVMIIVSTLLLSVVIVCFFIIVAREIKKRLNKIYMPALLYTGTA